MNKKNIAISISLIAILGLFVYSRSQNEQPKTPKEAEPVASIGQTRALLTGLDKQLASLQRYISQYRIELERVFFKKREQWNKTKDTIQKLTSEIKMMNNPEFIERLRRNKELYDILTTLNKEARQITFGTEKKSVIAQIIQLSSLYTKTITTHKLFEKIAEVLKVVPEKKQPEPEMPEYESEYLEETPYYEEEYESETYLSEEPEYETFEEYTPTGEEELDWDDYGFEFDF